MSDLKKFIAKELLEERKFLEQEKKSAWEFQNNPLLATINECAYERRKHRVALLYELFEKAKEKGTK